MNLHQIKVQLKSLSDLLQQMQQSPLGANGEQDKIRKQWEEANMHIGPQLSNIHEEEKIIFEEYKTTMSDFLSVSEGLTELDRVHTERGRQIVSFNQIRQQLHHSTSLATGMLGTAESQSREFEQKRQSISNSLHSISNELQKFIQSDR